MDLFFRKACASSRGAGRCPDFLGDWLAALTISGAGSSIRLGAAGGGITERAGCFQNREYSLSQRLFTFRVPLWDGRTPRLRAKASGGLRYDGRPCSRYCRAAPYDLCVALSLRVPHEGVALFESVASSPRIKSTHRRRDRIHEPKDVDVAVWLDVQSISISFACYAGARSMKISWRTTNSRRAPIIAGQRVRRR
jgi:hypothetical protein